MILVNKDGGQHPSCDLTLYSGYETAIMGSVWETENIVR